MSQHVLLVEDDPQTADYISASLSEAGCVVDHASDGAMGLKMARTGEHHCLVLDRMIEKIDGLAVLRMLRTEGCDTPVLILSAIGSTDERVRGLREGADDYLVKPFASAELVARVEALMRRRPAHSAVLTELSCHDLQMDVVSGHITRAGKSIHLSPRGTQLLAFLFRNKGKAVTRRMILEQVWHYDFDPGTNVIDVHISNLRRAIDPPGLTPLLHTVRGVGYRLCVNGNGR